jgi:uncharacterized membrane protein
MSETIIALYDSLDDANDAISDLVNEGFNRSDVGLVVNDTEGYHSTSMDSEDITAEEGAGIGALAGGITGLVVGLTALTIPGIGPIVAAGPLAVALGGAASAGIGAAAGAVTGGLTASLIDVGVPESQVDYYGEAIRRGSAMVTVVTNETRVTEAMRVLNRHNPFDLEHRARQWGDEGWHGYSESGFTGHRESEHSQMQRDDLAASTALNDNRARRYSSDTTH